MKNNPINPHCGHHVPHTPPVRLGEINYTSEQINALLGMIPFKADRAEVPEMEKLSDVNYVGHVVDPSLLVYQSQPSWALVGSLKRAKPYFYYVEGYVPKGYTAGWNDISPVLGTYDLTTDKVSIFDFNLVTEYNVSRNHPNIKREFSNDWGLAKGYYPEYDEYQPYKVYQKGDYVNMPEYTEHTFIALHETSDAPFVVTSSTNEFTLEEALDVVPDEYRFPGIKITFANSETKKAETYYWLGGDWYSTDRWIVPKGDNGLPPRLSVIGNKLHYSYDNENWVVCSDFIAHYFRIKDNKLQISPDNVNWENLSDYIAAYFRFKSTFEESNGATIGNIQISRDNKNWQNLSPEFINHLRISKYVATTSELPSSVPVGSIYGVGPIFREEDTGHTNPYYRLYAFDGEKWVDNGEFTSIAAGIVQETGDSETEVMSQKSVTEKLTELGSELSVIHFKGEGNVGVYRQIVGLLPNVTYRVYIKSKWNAPNVGSGKGVFQLYYKEDDDNYQMLHNVTSSTDGLKPYYDVVLPEGKNLVIWAKIVEGETATFVLEKMDTTIKDITFQRNALNTYIVGKGATYSSARFRGVKGRTYRISIPKKWNYPQIEGAIFYIGKTKDGIEKQLLSLDTNTIADIMEYYEIESSDEDYINIGGRAVEGENIYVLIEDVTDSFPFLKDSHIAGFNAQDMDMIGTYIPLKKQGYIPIGASDFEHPIFTFNYHYEVIPCKVGDIFFVKAKGGRDARLFMMYDKDLNMITFTDEDTDVSEIGAYFRCFKEGYFIVNADIRKEYKVLRVNSNIQNNLSPKFDVAKYINWKAGGVRWHDGSLFESSVNQITGFMCTFNYNKIRLNVNVSIGDNPSTGVAFYDSERNYISGIQNIVGLEVGSMIQEYNIPENAHYFRTTCFNDYTEGFVCELYKSETAEENSTIEKEESKTFNNFDLNWKASGYAHYYEGRVLYSSVNSYTEINVENYSKIKLTVNKSASPSSAGICFYNDKDEFIIGYPYPNFGDSSATSTYVENDFIIPYNAVKATVSFYTKFLSQFRATIYKETANGYNAISKVSNFASDVIRNITVGSPELYISEPTADKYTSLNNKTIEELYERWDNLVSKYPMYIRRGDDLGKVSDSAREYVIRQYIVGYNGRFMIDHETSKDEIVSVDAVNNWRNTDNPRKILINNGMHGEEKTPCWGAVLAIEELLESKENWALFIKSNFDLYIIPSLNPYGFHHCTRGNENGIVLNRDNARNEPEHLMYMSWVEQNKDAFALIDNHGTQGRYPYIPCFAGQPIFSSINKIAAQLSASLNSNYKEFYNSIKEGYGETYNPFLLAKYAHEVSYGRCAVEMLDRFGMTAFALETPDNLVVENSDGSINDNLSGLINYNDLRCCKITKDLLINFIQNVGVMKYNKII